MQQQIETGWVVTVPSSGELGVIQYGKRDKILFHPNTYCKPGVRFAGDDLCFEWQGGVYSPHEGEMVVFERGYNERLQVEVAEVWAPHRQYWPVDEYLKKLQSGDTQCPPQFVVFSGYCPFPGGQTLHYFPADDRVLSPNLTRQAFSSLSLEKEGSDVLIWLGHPLNEDQFSTYWAHGILPSGAPDGSWSWTGKEWEHLAA